jgi:uncharacterized protein YjiS (DUF1127 family)
MPTMSDFTITRFAPTRSTTAGRAGNSPAVLHTMLRTYLTRRSLPELTVRELADVGLSSSAALAEAARLPWDMTPNPRRNRPGISGRLQQMLERARGRRLLARLEARELRDFGVSPSDAQFEATKPFWRA